MFVYCFVTKISFSLVCDLASLFTSCIPPIYVVCTPLSILMYARYVSYIAPTCFSGLVQSLILVRSLNIWSGSSNRALRSSAVHYCTALIVFPCKTVPESNRARHLLKQSRFQVTAKQPLFDCKSPCKNIQRG